MKKNHTPAPWMVAGEKFKRLVIVGGDGFPLADFVGVPHLYDIQCANAHLIAAAPELLEALETILPRLAAIDAHGHHVDAVRAAYEAIKKAKGGEQ